MYSSDTGISLTAQSARPSSRSSLHSSGSIGSYGNRRPSSAPQSGSKGVLVSTSRTGAARSAAILLISCHISATNDNNQNRDGNYDIMTKHLQKQLKHQRQLLHLELPSLKTKNKKVINSLGMNGFDKNDDEMNSFDNGCITIGALPTPASETARFAVLDDQV
ncbi:unnamed protein product [Hermetia illucens]|uniref:Uncharacterized protein n=2 Tax=Hermetia illucens TaxID=343691 RepID=A0A7R8YQJ0_HERIL|nr:unnamed protein product [Hermetia illucens]